MAFRFAIARALGLFLALFLLAAPLKGQEPDPVVHVVFFYSPTCQHCHEVINTFLMPLQDEYGSRLVILGFDTSQKWANDLFWEALRQYEVPEAQWAVPFMIVEETVLIGGFEIPDQLPAILEKGLAEGGIDLPNFPALLTFMDERGLLDHRYPDRRIALQSPQDTQGQPEADTVAERAVPAQDTSGVGSEDPPVVESAAGAAAVDSAGKAPIEVPGAGEAPEEKLVGNGSPDS